MIKLSNNIIHISLEYSDLPDEFISPRIFDFPSLIDVIDRQNPGAGFELFPDTANFSRVSNFEYNCPFNVHNVGFVARLNTFINLPTDEKMTRYIARFEKQLEARRPFPSVKYEKGKLYFDNILTEQAAYLNLNSDSQYVDEEDWVPLMKTLQSQMLDIDQSVIDQSQRKIRMDTSGRINKATKNLLVNGGRGLFVNNDVRYGIRVAANYIKETKPKKTIILIYPDKIDAAMEALKDLDVSYGSGINRDSGIFLTSELNMSIISDSAPDFLVITDCFHDKQVLTAITQEIFSILFVSSFFIRFNHKLYTIIEKYNDLIWQNDQRDCINVISDKVKNADASYSAEQHPRLLQIVKKELRRVRIVV